MHRGLLAKDYNSDSIKAFGQPLTRFIFRKLLFSESRGRITLAGGAIELQLPNLIQTFRILLKPDIMVGQSYVDGHWSVQPERLFDFLRLIRSKDNSKLQRWFLFSNRFHLVRDILKHRLLPVRSTRAVVDHYNTDPIFMSLILGRTLSYTCAFFEKDSTSLDEAQEIKLELIAKRISLRNKSTLLDLGTGWGYAPFPLAEKYGCRVTGITISNTQVEFCNERKKSSSIGNVLEFICSDYADFVPPSRFDRVISIGMLEHVGKHQYVRFFNSVANYLNGDGIALIHCMIEEHETSPDAWIDKYIFPGGYIPTTSEVVAGIEKSNCEIIQIFTHDKSNYFRTLESWKQNLFRNRSRCISRLQEIGVSQIDATKIIRIWEYFLSSSQIAFCELGTCRIAHFIVRRKTQ